MTEPIPGLKKAPWHRKKWVAELVGIPPAVVTAGVGAAKLFQDPAGVLFGWISVGGIACLLVSVGFKVHQANGQDKKDDSEHEHDGLTAAMHVLLASVAHACGLSADAANKTLRVTFHRCVASKDDPTSLADPDQIEQIVNYVGRSASGKGRFFSVKSGIAGKAVRTREVYTASRINSDAEAYQRELQDTWGYTAKEVKKLAMDSYSWMAVPITDSEGQHVVGVVYLDSTNSDTFNGTERKEVILMACNGITNYVRKRYRK